MTNKSIDTLLEDIEDLFVNGTEFKAEYLEAFLDELREIMLDRFNKKEEEAPYIRMSMVGKKDRLIWNLFKKPKPRKKVADMKFIFGDIIESLLLLLAKQAGHKVEKQQAEIEINGVKGHIDAIIDGYVVDVKSASRFAFPKFSKGTLAQNDPFGYIAQISSYMHYFKLPGAFLALCKDTAERALLKVQDIDTIDSPRRIDQVKEIVESDTPPKRCYEPVPDGTAGNLILNTNCTYCQYKDGDDGCWKDANGGKGLRRFKYSNGIRYFVKVLKEPKVEEIFPLV